MGESLSRVISFHPSLPAKRANVVQIVVYKASNGQSRLILGLPCQILGRYNDI